MAQWFVLCIKSIPGAAHVHRSQSQQFYCQEPLMLHHSIITSTYSGVCETSTMARSVIPTAGICESTIAACPHQTLNENVN